MKIAFIRKRYTPFGGAEKYISALSKVLASEGHEIHIFANSWESEPNDKIKFHHVPTLKWGAFISVISFAIAAKLKIRREDFDIVHSFERTISQDIYRAGDGCHKEWLIQKRAAGSFFANILSYIMPLNISILAIENRIFKKGNYKMIIANSKRGRDEIIKHYGVEPERIGIIYNGVDLKEYHPDNIIRYRKEIRENLNISDSEILVLFVGSGFKRKGLRYLIQAVDIFRKRCENIRLIVAGKGDVSGYRSLAKSLGAERYIKFIGPYKDIKRLYAAADMFVLPTLYEPFSNACIEAMATGIPVITSRINGASELIEDGENGLIVKDPKNYIEISEKICILKNKTDRERIGSNGREAVGGFDISEQAKRTVEIYKNVLSM